MAEYNIKEESELQLFVVGAGGGKRARAITLGEKLTLMHHTLVSSRAQVPNLDMPLARAMIKEVDNLMERMALHVDGAFIKKIIDQMLGKRFDELKVR